VSRKAHHLQCWDGSEPFLIAIKIFIFNDTYYGHVDNADVNAAFNIALRQGRGQPVADRDVTEGNTDIPKEATLWTMETLEPP